MGIGNITRNRGKKVLKTKKVLKKMNPKVSQRMFEVLLNAKWLAKRSGKKKISVEDLLLCTFTHQGTIGSQILMKLDIKISDIQKLCCIEGLVITELLNRPKVLSKD